jgi:hypothetical protein
LNLTDNDGTNKTLEDAYDLGRGTLIKVIPLTLHSAIPRSHSALNATTLDTVPVNASEIRDVESVEKIMRHESVPIRRYAVKVTIRHGTVDVLRTSRRATELRRQGLMLLISILYSPPALTQIRKLWNMEKPMKNVIITQ